MTMTSNPSAPPLGFTLTTGWPQVDLLPPEVRAGRKLRHTKRILLLVVAGILLASLLGYVATLFAAASAQSDLDDVILDTARLQSQQSKYAEVPQVLGDITSIEGARTAGTSTEILWKPYFDALRAVTPAGVSIDDLSVTTATPLMAAAPAISPLAGASIGQIVFTAKSLTVPDTSAWLDALDAVPGLGDPWFSSSTLTETEGVVYWSISATVEVNDLALANRFAVEKGN
ncbi:MAG: PilN domain-containing protein [Cellulomonas sp.]